MEDWQYAQADRAEELAQLHYFTMNKNQNGKNVPFVITVNEFSLASRTAFALLRRSRQARESKHRCIRSVRVGGFNSKGVGGLYALDPAISVRGFVALNASPKSWK